MTYVPPDPNIEKGYSPEAAQAAAQAQIDAEKARQAEVNAANPLDTSEAGMRSRGVGLATDLTSPGGPWHGLPAEAAADSGHPDFAENQRWAIVENAESSWFPVTHDQTANFGDHAENVLGYVQASDDGRKYLQSATVDQATAIGNDIAYRGGYAGYVA